MESYNLHLKPYSQKLRNTATDAEQKLWQQLRCKQILGLQFNRQKPILNFIVDFYCAKAKLVIELDGGQHFEESFKRKDHVREQHLQGKGLKVLRFTNIQVLQEMRAVLDVIYETARQRTKS